MLNRLADLSEGQTLAINLANLHSAEDLRMYGATSNQKASLRRKIDSLREQVLQGATESNLYKERHSCVADERDDLKEQLKDVLARLHEHVIRSRELVGENDRLLAMRLAAELERDALSKSFLELRKELYEKAVQLKAAGETSHRVSLLYKVRTTD